jgi:formamidopyrimidine-DNA glycosylase
MPELPEVETVVRELAPQLIGCTISTIQADWPRTIARPQEDIEAFCEGISGRTIVGLRRRGKFIVFDLDDGQHMLIHLRMSGRLMLSPDGDPRHLRVVFKLANGGRFYFYNQRKFGRIWLVKDTQTVVGDLGPEPLDPDLTVDRFTALFDGRRGMIKPLLLNQRFIAGMGNIYVDEALFRAGLHPERKADTLTDADLARLYQAIRAVLRQALDHHGTTFDGIFVRPSGQEGRQQEGLCVYGQQDRPCVRCGELITRIVVGGRGTHICVRCQPPDKGQLADSTTEPCSDTDER